MRETEGERLKADVLSRLLTMEEHLSFVEERSPQTVAEYRARLTAKLTELLNGAVPDENRILTEVGIIADRLAVDEETVRLRPATSPSSAKYWNPPNRWAASWTFWCRR